MNFNKILLFTTVIILISINNTNAQETCNLKVIVNGLKNSQGQIMISINQGAVGWPEENFYEQRFIAEFNAPTHIIYFENLPYGNYAIGLLHDENVNGEMNKNFIGIPKEGFAFSRNYKVMFRAPKYEEANFEVNASKKTIIIHMQY
ncbi:Uncharacterized conserved protein, DUF2141 family [Lutibacter agarilyticus]|uniref:Uncharacterized conserved protein, DUF2141 family n=1 Tax=Lutibacter agarilyticus TaxID=1109740 RepID=A0A238Y8R9_9FLAO|nr:DUF2141 domain-containing protein [Lutibacter agarilyticus]SNR67238.1 Uncharacterized conserved protein, DUF2141 family [Lutibacter agarilyticus]